MTDPKTFNTPEEMIEYVQDNMYIGLQKYVGSPSNCEDIKYRIEQEVSDFLHKENIIDYDVGVKLSDDGVINISFDYNPPTPVSYYNYTASFYEYKLSEEKYKTHNWSYNTCLKCEMKIYMNDENKICNSIGDLSCDENSIRKIIE